MILETQMTLALLQELLMALRANDADGYKSWIALGIEKLGKDVATNVESEWMVPLLVEEERNRLMAVDRCHISCAFFQIAQNICTIGGCAIEGNA